MALRERQRRAYTDTCDLYEPSFVIDTDFGALDQHWEATPTYTDVPCLFEGTPNANSPEMAGSTKQENLFTMDKFHLPIDYPITSGWLIRMQRPGSPSTGYCWVVQGNPEQHYHHAAAQIVFGVETPLPAGVTL